MYRKVIRKNEQITSSWSGGTTTELAIFPENSNYSKRNFMWRLSSARVELKESSFTILPKTSRIIMVIKGEIKLIHEGHYETYLKPFDQDSFMGDYITRSIGKVRDFNLMMKDGCSGKLEGIQIHKNSSKRISIDTMDMNYKMITEAFYCASGEVEGLTGKDSIKLDEGDLLILDINNNEKIEVEFKSENNSSSIIRASIFN